MDSYGVLSNTIGCVTSSEFLRENIAWLARFHGLNAEDIFVGSFLNDFEGEVVVGTRNDPVVISGSTFGRANTRMTIIFKASVVEEIQLLEINRRILSFWRVIVYGLRLWTIDEYHIGKDSLLPLSLIRMPGYEGIFQTLVRDYQESGLTEQEFRSAADSMFLSRYLSSLIVHPDPSISEKLEPGFVADLIFKSNKHNYQTLFPL